MRSALLLVSLFGSLLAYPTAPLQQFKEENGKVRFKDPKEELFLRTLINDPDFINPMGLRTILAEMCLFNDFKQTGNEMPLVQREILRRKYLFDKVEQFSSGKENVCKFAAGFNDLQQDEEYSVQPPWSLRPILTELFGNDEQFQ